MPGYTYAPTAARDHHLDPQGTQDAQLGFDADAQCALPEGCASEVPTLDEIFWEGFVDEHGGLIGDITTVTSRAMELHSGVPDEAHRAVLDHHIDGLFHLDEVLATAISTAQASSSYDGEVLLLDDAAVQRVLDIWHRVEVGLDLLREYNGLYAALAAQDIGPQLEELSRLAAAIVEAGIAHSMEEASRATEAQLAAFEEAWKGAAHAVVKLPADMLAGAVITALIEAALPSVVGAVAVAGLSGPVVAAGIAGGMALAAGAAWTALSDRGADSNDLHGGISSLNGTVGLIAGAASIEQVEEVHREVARSAKAVGTITGHIGTLLSVVEASVAIDAALQASAAWEAFLVEHERLQAVWQEAKVLLGGFLGFADRVHAGLSDLVVEVARRNDAIFALEANAGDLYAI